MVTRDTPWEPGTPCWVELMTNDVAGARLFYEELFGWHLRDTGPESGGYLLVSVNERQLGGISGMMGGMDHPPVWNTYIASDSADDTAAAITAAGGRVVMGPMDVMDAGRMVVAQDPTGAAICVWQAGTNKGMQIANEPNTPTWNECLTRDVARARQFYGDVFGWTYEDAGSDGFQYVVGQVDGRGIAGIGDLPSDVPESVPAHWRVYFEVDDADDAVDRAVKLGAVVRMPAQDTPFGRMADLADPQGAPFSIIHGQSPDA